MVFKFKLLSWTDRMQNPYLPANVLAFIQKKFSEIDVEQRGNITAEQASKGLMQCGYNAELQMIQGILRMCDENGDSLISLNEFVRIVICLSLAESRKAKIYMFFVGADRNLSGSVNRNEFVLICKKLGLDRDQGLFKKVLHDIKKELNVEQYLINIARLQGRLT